jgi:hypothetical protein
MWLDHCVSTPCDSITAAVPRWISRFFALLDGYVSSPCGSITAVPRWISLSAPSVPCDLLLTLDLLQRLHLPCSITAFQHHVARSLRLLDFFQRSQRTVVLRPARSLRFIAMWLDHCGSSLDLLKRQPTIQCSVFVLLLV